MTRRIVHFIFGLRPQLEPFHLLHYLAIASCREVLEPDEIRLHVHELPFGIYWDLARPLVTLERIEPISQVAARSDEDGMGRYRYAHHADVIRLDLLAQYGGMYADIDTLFVRPVPDLFWEKEAVIGAEKAAQYDDAELLEASHSNALLMSLPRSTFITLWREQIIDAMDGSWSGHSCRLATRIANDHPSIVHREPKASFSPFDHTIEGMHSLLEAPLDQASLAETYSVHLCEHLWWEIGRQDFSRLSAPDVTEHYLREADTPLAHLARPFLPTHGLF